MLGGSKFVQSVNERMVVEEEEDDEEEE